MKDLGIALLAIWLILVGLHQVADLNFRYYSLINGMLAIIAGILVLIKR